MFFFSVVPFCVRRKRPDREKQLIFVRKRGLILSDLPNLNGDLS